MLAGGQNDRVFRFPGRAAYPEHRARRAGVGFGEDLYLWHEDFLKGEGKRRNGLIFLANETRIPIKCWTFERGIPVKWSGPALNAGTSATAIEKLEIAHEKLTLTMSPGQAARQRARRGGALSHGRGRSASHGRDRARRAGTRTLLSARGLHRARSWPR